MRLYVRTYMGHGRRIVADSVDAQQTSAESRSVHQALTCFLAVPYQTRHSFTPLLSDCPGWQGRVCLVMSACMSCVCVCVRVVRGCVSEGRVVLYALTGRVR